MSRFPFDDVRLTALLRQQDGVVARRQLLALGAAPHDVKRLLRRRDLARVFDGVYVSHTGPLTPRQREWVAVLAAWPAALTGASALPELTAAQVYLAVEHGRKVRVPSGVVVRRSRQLDRRVSWSRSPPRVREEHAILDVMSEKVVHDDDVAGAFHALTQVAHARRTTPGRILAALDDRPRLPGRAVIRGMLRDLLEGACSVLEREYLQRVERAHGLPRADRQRRSTATGGLTLQDVPYPEYRLIVELDGGGYHAGARADADAFRDLAELARSRKATVRVTYGLVFRTPCRTARFLAEVLQQRGWRGTATRCRRCRGSSDAGSSGSTR
ncbi:type IV toxin-antitoxin system AbiEi family antitoxin domain-containing protein [Pseudactinotalea suaedae]|uniref:type IV toxin-antitoxin system AbiEi family antitoxin domain-containing protein n=1 Tax=Pseudactinotalea suaedae TaxID=1524924 RepID=UPI0012E1E096|nr:type IV toxin-antitoxin system AbiEi family antitoxin domain-containing protein [Pseudactinotalea suaedae]